MLDGHFSNDLQWKTWYFCLFPSQASHSMWTIALLKDNKIDIIILTEIRQRQIPSDATDTWNEKNLYKWTYLQKRNRLTNIEKKKLMVTER